MLNKELISATIPTLNLSDSVIQALDLMSEFHVMQLPVVTEEKYLGLVFEEDLMNHIQIAGIDFFGAKLCARCVLTTINQQTGIKAKEPLKTLASYRLKNKKIMFGQNLIHEGTGIISIGDMITTLTTHEEDRFMVSHQ